MPAPEWMNQLETVPDMPGAAWPGVLGELCVSSYQVTKARSALVGKVSEAGEPVLFAISGMNGGYVTRRHLIASAVHHDPDRWRLEMHSYSPDSELEGCDKDTCGVAEGEIETRDDGMHLREYRASGLLHNGQLLVGRVALATALLRGYKGGTDIHGGRMQLMAAQVMVEDRGHTLSDNTTVKAFDRVIDVGRSITRLRES